MDYTRGYVTAVQESRGIRPGRPFKQAHRMETASTWVHAVVPGGAPVSLCQRRVSRLGRDEPAWDAEEQQACGLCADEAVRRQTDGGPASE